MSKGKSDLPWWEDMRRRFKKGPRKQFSPKLRIRPAHAFMALAIDLELALNETVDVLVCQEWTRRGRNIDTDGLFDPPIAGLEEMAAQSSKEVKSGLLPWEDVCRRYASRQPRRPFTIKLPLRSARAFTMLAAKLGLPLYRIVELLVCEEWARRGRNVDTDPLFDAAPALAAAA